MCFLGSAETHLPVLTEGGDVLQCCSNVKGNTKALLLCKTEQEANGEVRVCWRQVGQGEN